MIFFSNWKFADQESVYNENVYKNSKMNCFNRLNSSEFQLTSWLCKFDSYQSCIFPAKRTCLASTHKVQRVEAKVSCIDHRSWCRCSFDVETSCFCARWCGKVFRSFSKLRLSCHASNIFRWTCSLGFVGVCWFAGGICLYLLEHSKRW